jgi:hypothetical protein
MVQLWVRFHRVQRAPNDFGLALPQYLRDRFHKANMVRGTRLQKLIQSGEHCIDVRRLRQIIIHLLPYCL